MYSKVVQVLEVVEVLEELVGIKIERVVVVFSFAFRTRTKTLRVPTLAASLVSKP